MDMAVTMGSDLHLVVLGQGQRVLFVHGSFGEALEDWKAQRQLEDQFQLLLLDRRGYGDSPPRLAPVTWDVSDFGTQAEEIAALLGNGMHLVGHSYGGLLCLLAAAQRPEAVRSLTVIEPPAYALARGHPDVEGLIAQLEPVYAAAAELTPDDFRVKAFAAMGFMDPPRLLSARERKNATATMAEPPGWLAAVPLDELASVPFPKLVVSGAWGGASNCARDVAGRACAAICTVLVERLAAEYAVINGAGHAVQYTGARFNKRLATFLAASASR